MTEKLTRDHVREAFGKSAAKAAPITFERMRSLRNHINAEMLKDGLMDGTFHMAHPSRIKVHGDDCAELRCVSHYFQDREAVTFNAGGFVGFAGWADEYNVQPILRGFVAWMDAEALQAIATLGEEIEI